MSTFPLIIEIHPPDGPVTKFSVPVGETIICDWRYDRDGMDPELLESLNEETNKVFLFIPPGVKMISDYAFAEYSAIYCVIIPEGVKLIGNYAFYKCRSLNSFILPEDLMYIGESAFGCCTSLISASIPEGVTCISSRTFSGCKSLASVSIPNGVTAINIDAFTGCDLLTVVIPQSCVVIQSGAFKDCTNLSLVVSPQDFEVEYYEDHFMIEDFITGGSVEDVFENCPCLTLPYITPYSRDAVLAACRMEYWTQTNHSLIKPFRRDWVLFVVLMLTHLKLPSLVQLKILKMLKRYELGKLISS
jgi:hypothetical protein